MLTWRRGAEDRDGQAHRPGGVTPGLRRGGAGAAQPPASAPPSCTPTKDTTPLALHAERQVQRVSRDEIIIVSVTSRRTCTYHWPEHPGGSLDCPTTDRVVRLVSVHGRRKHPQGAGGQRPGVYPGSTSIQTAFYFLSRITIESGPAEHARSWQERLFTALVHNSGSPAADFCLPAERTLSVANRIEI